MKKSELKNIIKEIISEIKVVRGNSNLDDFNRMLELNYGEDYTFIEGFIQHDTFEEWQAGEDEIGDESEEEKAEYARLAKIYFDWKEKGLIYVDQATDEDTTTDVLSKSYIRITTLGIGWGRVLIILTAF